MHVLPSGQRRQMESQEYLHDTEASSSIVEKMLRKAAVLDIAPDDAAQQLAAPAPPPTERPGPVADAMNESNVLPGAAPVQGFTLDEYDANNKTHQALLNALTQISEESGLVSPGIFKHKVMADAGSITINFIRTGGPGEKLIEKP